MIKTLEHTLALYIAPKIENEILCSIEGNRKSIICKIQTITFEPSKIIDKEYIKQGMKRAKQSYEEGRCDFWIAGVGYMNNFFKENNNSILIVDESVVENYEAKND